MRRHKILRLLVIALILCISIPSFGQFGQPGAEKKAEFKMQKRLYLGGGLSFGISSSATSLMITPTVGYRLSPSFDIGARFTYNYFHSNYNGIKYSTNNYGAGFFARYYLFFFNDLFLHAEYEALNFEYADFFNYNTGEVVKVREWISGLFIGGGYRQWIGPNAFVGITVLFNVMDPLNSPYSNPILRIGVGVGI